MADDPLMFRQHAIQQMVLRKVTEIEVRDALEHGEVIEIYPDEQPFPSRLVLGTPDGRPIHVVAMDNPDEELTYIITVYEPDPARRTDGFRKRR